MPRPVATKVDPHARRACKLHPTFMISGACESCGKALCARCAPELRRQEPAYCGSCKAEREPEPVHDPEMVDAEPFGGLLWLWAFQIALFPLLLGAMAAITIWARGAIQDAIAHRLPMRHPKGMTPQAVQASIDHLMTLSAVAATLEIGLALAGALVAYLFFSKSKITPWLLSGLMVLGFLFALAGVLTGEESGVGPEAQIAGGQQLVAAAYGLFWVPYFLTSKRVARTFVH